MSWDVISDECAKNIKSPKWICLMDFKLEPGYGFRYSFDVI